MDTGSLRAAWVGRRVWVNFSYQQGYAQVVTIDDRGGVVLQFEQGSSIQFPFLAVGVSVLGRSVIAV